MSESFYLPSPQIDSLRAMLRGLPESSGVLRLDCEIAKYPNFFPGGRGHKSRFFPQSPVMFIGHNFDTDAGFRRSVDRGSEDPRMPTWRNMRELFLPTAGLDENDCFFTNLYLGAIVHPEPKNGEKRKTANTGTFKRSPQYRNASVKGLRAQVEIVRPKVIALLGGKVPPAFAEAFPVFMPHCGANLTKTQAKQRTSGYRLQLLSDLRVQVISLAHPANPRSNESHRAQGLLLRSAIEAAGLP